MTSCHSKQESQTNFSSPAFSELIHQELLLPPHHCSVNKIIIISLRLLIKVECQGIVRLLAQYQISLTVVTGGGAERGKLRKSHYICGKWSLCNASIARLVFDAIKIRMTTRSICLVSRTVFSYRRYVRFKQMLVHHVFHFLRHEQEQPGMRQV